mgnify:CR=1 FL=1
MSEEFECEICGKKFDKERGLHLHISKAHKLEISKYYEEYCPKKSLLFGKKIPFKNIKDYKNRDFLNRAELIQWCNDKNKSETLEYCRTLLKKRIEEKGIKYLLSHVELELCDLPDIDTYRKIFGSYCKLSKPLGVKNLLKNRIPENFFQVDSPQDLEIFVDTREQKPLKFKKSIDMKLDFGDYTCGGKYYDYTYVDRKSEQDFKSTLSGKNYERFKRELDRARELNSFIFIGVESSIEKIKLNNNFGAHKSKLPYIWHNLKEMSQSYKDVCQVLFLHNRSGLKNIIPKLLLYGKELWNVDLQYYIDKKIDEKQNTMVS